LLTNQQLATIDIEQYYAAMDTFSDLSLLVYRYKSVEEFYLHQEEDDVFEAELIKLYTMVLKCQVALIAHFRRNGLREHHPFPAYHQLSQIHSV
jgi:hypothetical protein